MLCYTAYRLVQQRLLGLGMHPRDWQQCSTWLLPKLMTTVLLSLISCWPAGPYHKGFRAGGHCHFVTEKLLACRLVPEGLWGRRALPFCD